MHLSEPENNLTPFIQKHLATTKGNVQRIQHLETELTEFKNQLLLIRSASTGDGDESDSKDTVPVIPQPEQKAPSALPTQQARGRVAADS